MAKTVYECYRTNGNKAGFWVRRNVWDRDNTFFVKRIGQQTRGSLPANSAQCRSLAVLGDAYQGDIVLKRNARLEYAATFSWLYLGSEKGMEKIASGA